MKRMLVLMLGLLFALTACGQQTSTPEAAPTEEISRDPLPDLVFGGFDITMDSISHGSCVAALGPVTTTVCVRNQGDADAGSFVVKGGVPDWVVDGLAVGEEVCTDYAGSPRDMTIDPDGAVDEYDDNNNFYVLPVPTQAVICTPQAPASEGSSDALPDLAFVSWSIEMEGHTPGMCVEAYGPVTTTVCIKNQGEGDAGSFVISGGLPEFTVDKLPAGEEVCHVYSSSPGQVVIDLDDEIAETDETNNNTFVPVATPPALCTPDASGDD